MGNLCYNLTIVMRMFFFLNHSATFIVFSRVRNAQLNVLDEYRSLLRQTLLSSCRALVSKKNLSTQTMYID